MQAGAEWFKGEKTEDLYGMLFQRSPLVKWIVSLEDVRFLDVNCAAVERYGYQRETFLASDLRLVRPNDPVVSLVADYEAFSKEPTLSHPRRHRAASGKWLDVNVRVHPLLGGMALAQVLDTSEVLQAQSEREEAIKRLQTTLDGALDAVISIDGNSRIVEWSGESEELFGWTRDEALGRSMPEMIMPESYRESHYKGISRHLVAGTSRIIGQKLKLAALTKSGHEVPILLRITRIPGTPVTFTAFARPLRQDDGAE